MHNLNKRAMSNLIFSVFLILLGTAIIATLFLIINTLITEKVDLSPDSSCLQLRLNNQLEVKSSCYNQNTNQIELTLKASTNSKNLNSLEFNIVSNNKISQKLSCGLTCSQCQVQEAGETKTYFLPSSQESNVKEIFISQNNCELTRSIVNIC